MKKISSLDFAHTFELKGVNLYLRLARRTVNVLGKKVFYSLAGQEIDHARRIDEIQAQLNLQQGWKPIATITLPKMEEELKKIFKHAARHQLKKGEANIQGYTLAMKMEKNGYQTYERFAADAENREEKAFFKHLMEEEDGHYEALSNVYAFLTDDVDWIRTEESKIWNWMNL